MIIQYSLILATMLYASGMAFAQSSGADVGPKPQLSEPGKKIDTEWVSYRDAYKLMIQFQKYGKPKQLIQNHFQVSVKSGQVLPEDLQLNLISKSMRLNLPLDAMGRTNFPLLKAAYDENAELTLSQSSESTEPFIFQRRVSIQSRADGVYEITDLRSACEQAQAFLSSVGDTSVKARSCVGVRFAYSKNLAQPVIKWRGSDMQLHTLAVQEGSAFPGEAAKIYKVASFKFADATEKGQVLTQQLPVAITPVFE